MIFHSKVCFLFVYCYCPCILLIEGKGFSILFLYCIKPVKSYFISCLGGLYCNVSHYNRKKNIYSLFDAMYHLKLEVYF